MPCPVKNAVPDVPVPPKLKLRPFDERGYLVPWFVATIDGKPDFRVIGAGKFQVALVQKRCWLCGGQIGVFKTFVVGPMCAVNRTSSEPPSHRECAEYAVRACPFLVKPHALRRQGGLPEDAREPAGLMLSRNPGVSMLWTTTEYSVFKAHAGTYGYLLQMGRPSTVEFFAEGRLATVDEIQRSVETGLPHLRTVAELESAAAVKALEQTLIDARRHFPAGVFDTDCKPLPPRQESK